MDRSEHHNTREPNATETQHNEVHCVRCEDSSNSDKIEVKRECKPVRCVISMVLHFLKAPIQYVFIILGVAYGAKLTKISDNLLSIMVVRSSGSVDKALENMNGQQTMWVSIVLLVTISLNIWITRSNLCKDYTMIGAASR